MSAQRTHPDRYTRRNVVALEVLVDNGRSIFNGIDRATIRAFARRGLVWDLGDGRATVTEEGTAVIAAIRELRS